MRFPMASTLGPFAIGTGDGIAPGRFHRRSRYNGMPE